MFLFIDNETGGIGLETSLLTSCLVLTDDKFNLIDELNLALAPENGIYNVTAQGLTVNRINIVEHDKEAICYGKAGAKVHDLLRKYSKQGSEKLIPAGHGIYFDLTHIWDKIYSRKNWEQWCSYRVMDTSSIGRMLLTVGRIPATLTGSLEGYAQHFGLLDGKQLHTARADTLLTIEVAKKFMEMLK